MTITDPTMDDLAQLCAALARDEACEIRWPPTTRWHDERAFDHAENRFTICER
jgi:hypothetical protein